MSDEHVERLLRMSRALIRERTSEPGVLGAALDGSLATGRAWPTSDLDFSVFPRVSRRPDDARLVPAYRFYYVTGPLARHGEYVDLRVVDGVFVNVHIKTQEAVEALLAGYPRSFVESAETLPDDAEPTHYVDGLSIMKIVEDETGFLERTKSFVAARRFAPEVLSGRLALLLSSARRKLEDARRAASTGQADFKARYDVARAAAQAWLEAHARVYSKKEQDALLAEVAAEAGEHEIHELYRETLGLGLPASTLEAILPLVAGYAERVDQLFQIVESMAKAHVEILGADVVERVQAFRLWTTLSAQSVPVAFEKGCYAHMAFVMQGIGPAALQQFVDLLREVTPAEAPQIEEACRVEIARGRPIWELFGQVPAPPEQSERRLDAAARLVEQTERALGQKVAASTVSTGASGT